MRITTGFVEPHFFAGFSGGPKLVAPGLAGLETVLTLHDAARIGAPSATWGVLEGNPVHDDIRGDRRRRPASTSPSTWCSTASSGWCAAFGGSLSRDARRGPRGRARSWRCRRCRQLFDVVVTTNSGYPLDQNLYQAVKGMTAGGDGRQARRH